MRLASGLALISGGRRLTVRWTAASTAATGLAVDGLPSVCVRARTIMSESLER